MDSAVILYMKLENHNIKNILGHLVNIPRYSTAMMAQRYVFFNLLSSVSKITGHFTVDVYGIYKVFSARTAVGWIFSSFIAPGLFDWLIRYLHKMSVELPNAISVKNVPFVSGIFTSPLYFLQPCCKDP